MLAHVRLVVDILSIQLLVWLFGTNGELLDSHLFFYHRYTELAEHHRRRGRHARAAILEAIADAHYVRAPDDDEPPEAASMAMPVPRPPIFTNAVSALRITPRRDRARSFVRAPAL